MYLYYSPAALRKTPPDNTVSGLVYIAIVVRISNYVRALLFLSFVPWLFYIYKRYAPDARHGDTQDQWSGLGLQMLFQKLLKMLTPE